MNTDMYRRSIGQWAKRAGDGLAGLARASIQDMAEIVIDGTRVDTGFLVASWQPGIGAPDLSEVDGLGNGYAQSRMGVVVAQIKLGDVFYYTNNAAYARRREHGFVGYDSLGRYYNEKGDHNVIGAAAQWNLIVEAAAERLGITK